MASPTFANCATSNGAGVGCAVVDGAGVDGADVGVARVAFADGLVARSEVDGADVDVATAGAGADGLGAKLLAGGCADASADPMAGAWLADDTELDVAVGNVEEVEDETTERWLLVQAATDAAVTTAATSWAPRETRVSMATSSG